MLVYSGYDRTYPALHSDRTVIIDDKVTELSCLLALLDISVAVLAVA